jgi:DNA-directed RNA polymerase
MCARLIAKSIPAERLPEAMEEYSSRKKHGVSRGGLPLTRLKKEQMTSVVWTTGLGLPIVQPYRKSNRKQIMTSLQTVYISDPNSPAEGEFGLFCLFIVLLMCSLCSQLVEASIGVPTELYT